MSKFSMKLWVHLCMYVLNRKILLFFLVVSCYLNLILFMFNLSSYHEWSPQIFILFILSFKHTFPSARFRFSTSYVEVVRVNHVLSLGYIYITMYKKGRHRTIRGECSRSFVAVSYDKSDAAVAEEKHVIYCSCPVSTAKTILKGL